MGWWFLLTEVWSEGGNIITGVFLIVNIFLIKPNHISYLRWVRMPPYSELMVLTDSRGGFEKIRLLQKFTWMVSSSKNR